MNVSKKVSGKSRDKGLVRLGVWYLLWILLFLGILFLVLRAETVWNQLGPFRPYNSVFLSMHSLDSNRNNGNSLIFFFGDSSVAGPFLSQRDPRYVNAPKILQRQLYFLNPAMQHVDIVDWSFAGASMFEFYCLLCRAEKYKPLSIIVPINWRMFSPAVYDDPDWDFSELSVLAPIKEDFDDGVTNPMQLEHISMMSRLRLQLKFWSLYPAGMKYSILSKLRSERTERNGFIIRALVGQSERQLLEKLRNTRLTREQALSVYPMQISENNKMINLLAAFADAAARRKIPVIFYVTPINVERLRALGAFDAVMFQQSLTRIKAAATAHNATFLDLSENLAPPFFVDLYEHYSEAGHQKIADWLLPYVLKTLEKSIRSSYSTPGLGGFGLSDQTPVQLGKAGIEKNDGLRTEEVWRIAEREE